MDAGYVVCWLLVAVVGLCSLAWIATRGLPSVWLGTALACVPLPVALLQWRMHERMGYSGWLGEWFGRRAS